MNVVNKNINPPILDDDDADADADADDDKPVIVVGLVCCYYLKYIANCNSIVGFRRSWIF